MGVVQLMIFCIFYLIYMAIDLVLFFLVVRVLVGRWPTWWLVGFDAAGQKLIDALLPRLGSLWNRTFHTQLSDQGRLLTALVVFTVAWLAVRRVAPVVCVVGPVHGSQIVTGTR